MPNILQQFGVATPQSNVAKPADLSSTPTKTISMRKPQPYLERAKALIDAAKNSQMPKYGGLSATLGAMPEESTPAPQSSKSGFQSKLEGMLGGTFAQPEQAAKGGEVVKDVGSFLWDATGRPIVQSALNFNPITYAIQGARGVIPGGKDGNDPLIKDNPITGQVGGLSAKQMLGLVAETGATLYGGGLADDLAKGSLKEFFKRKGAKVIGEGAVVGALGAGGYEAEQEESTLKSIATMAGVGAGLGAGLGVVSGGATWLSKSVAREGIEGLSDEVTVLLKDKGIYDETKKVVDDALEEYKAIKKNVPGTKVTADEVVSKRLSESPVADTLTEVAETIKGKSTTQKVFDTGALKATDQRIPTKTIKVSQRAALVSTVKSFMKGLKTGAKWATEDLQAIKKTAETFIKQAIPDQGLTKGEASRLLSSLASVADEKQLDTVLQRAIDIAENSARRDLRGQITVSVRDVLSKMPKITPSMVLKADQVSAGAVAVAQKERNQIALLSNFLELGAKNAPTTKYRSISSLVKDSPAFGMLSKDMQEAIAGISGKTFKDFDAGELGRLDAMVKTLIAQGKARTQQSLIQRHKTIEGLVDVMQETATNVGKLSESDMIKIAQEVDDAYLTTQSWFDLMDGGVGAKTKWQKTGRVYQILKDPVDRASAELDKEAKGFLLEFSEMIDEVKPKLTDESGQRISIYAYSKQPSARAALEKKLGADAVNSIELTDAEMQVYNFMREKLDDIKPELDGIMIETQGRGIGYIQDYFPLFRDFDSFDEISKMLDESITGRSFSKLDPSSLKKSAQFSSIRASRTGKADKYADIQLDAFKIFTNYMNKAMYFKHMELPIQNIKLIAGNERFQGMVGDRAEKFLQGWVKRLASGGKKESTLKFDKYVSILKRNLSVAYLAKVSTAMKQFTSGLLATGYINPARTAQGFGLAMESKWRKFAFDNSDSLRLRSGGDVDLFELHKDLDLIGQTGFSASVQKTLKGTQQYFLKNTVERTDAFTATAVWLGSYKKGMALFGGDEARAFKYADDIVDRTQVSPHFKDVARVQNMSTMLNTLMPFQTFAIGQWNVIRQDLLKGTWLNAKEKQWLAAANSAGIGLALFMAMTAEEAVDYTFSNPEYKADSLLEHYKENLLPSAFSQVPIVGAFIKSSMSGYGQPFLALGADKIQKMSDALFEILSDPLDAMPSVVDLGSQGATLMGLPTGAFSQTYQMANELGVLGSVQGLSPFGSKGSTSPQIPPTYVPPPSSPNY